MRAITPTYSSTSSRSNCCSYLDQKDTPYMYIDTHAGAGVYALDGGYAAKNAEYETGIGRAVGSQGFAAAAGRIRATDQGA